MTDYKALLLKLNENLNLLREREAKYGINAPLELVNQIADHREAIALTEQVIRGELSEAEWREELKPLLVAIEARTGPVAGVSPGETGGIVGAILRDCPIIAGGDVQQTINNVVVLMEPYAAGEDRALPPAVKGLMEVVLGQVGIVSPWVAQKYRENPARYQAPLSDALTELLEADRGLAARLEMLLAQHRQAVSYQAYLAGSGAVAQGDRAQAAGERAAIAGTVGENIITGDNNSVIHIVNHYLGGSQVPDPAGLGRQIGGYLTWLRDRCGTIELRGIKREGKQVVQLDLETVYVPLVVDAFGTRKIRLDQVLSLDERLIITGGPGSGKTTVLLHIAWTLAMAILTDNPNLAHQKLGFTVIPSSKEEAKDLEQQQKKLPLPIFLPLSAYAMHLRHLPPNAPATDYTLAAFISHYLIKKQSSFDLPADFFQRLLQNGQAVILLLDGLDEVPDEAERARVREAIEELVTGRDNMRAVVTCRSAAYKERTALGKGFRQAQVLPLADEQIESLVRQAYACIYRHDAGARQSKADELLRGIRHLEEDRRRRLGKEVERLVSSPLLVRMLLMVHFSERRLPEQRAELYMKATDAMLLPEYGPDEEIADRIGRLVGGSREVHRDLVQQLAFAMHNRGDEQGREIGEDELRRVLERAGYAGLVDDFLALTRLRGTLLEERLGVYRFIHLAFQEYLAARYLAEVIRGPEEMVAFLAEGRLLESWWREPALLVAGYLSVTSTRAAQSYLQRLAHSPGEAEMELAGAEVAGMALLEWPTAGAELRQELAGRLAGLMEDGDLMNQVSVSGRMAAGNTLARLGDPRPGVGLRSDGLPDIVWCEVPAGPFLMGSDESKDSQAEDDEQPQHTVTLPAYRIAKYPVTNAQYAAFVRDGGYTDKWRHCWTEAGWQWKGNRTGPKTRGEVFDLPNHPVVYVTWYEAIAFCHWLTERLRQTGGVGPKEVVMLPTEAQWEKAARGPDGRIYPWGDEFDPNRANCGETGIGATSAVGCFSGGVSPYGCLGMAGNVWEWCLSLYKSYPYRDDDRNDPKAGGSRVWRGGSWGFGPEYARVSYRGANRPDPFDGIPGFRVVVAPVFS